MKRTVAVFSLLLATGAYALGATPPQPSRDILGIRIGMNADAARGELKRIGRFQRAEKRGQEVWQVDDAKYSEILIAFDKAGRVRYVTAVAKPGAVRYADVGDVKTARQTGDTKIKNFKYEWTLAASGKEPRIIVYAYGRDPQYLQTYSLERAN